MEVLSSLARLLSWFPPFGLLEPEKSRLSAWTSWWNLFFMKKYFSAENVFSKFFFMLLSLYKNSGGFLGVFLGQTQYAYDFPKLSLILCLENMLKLLGPFKKYVRSDGGGETGYSTNVRKHTTGGSLPRVYVSLYFFKGVFSHLNCLCFFVFHFFNGKVKTLTPWKVALYSIATHLTSWRYQDINF